MTYLLEGDNYYNLTMFISFPYRVIGYYYNMLYVRDEQNVFCLVRKTPSIFTHNNGYYN